MADAEWRLNGVALSDPARGWSLQAGSVWRAPVVPRLSQVELPGRSGEVPTGPPGYVLEAPLLTFEWLVCAPSMLGLDRTLDDLYVLLASTPLRVTRVVVRDWERHETFADARLVSIAERDGARVGPGTASVRVVAQLRMPGVAFRGPITEAALSVNGRTALVGLVGSTAPIPDAVIRVTGPATYAAVVDEATGTSITWTGNLPAGQYAYLDAGRLLLHKSGSPSAWDAPGADSPELDYSVAGPLRVTPRVPSYTTDRTVAVVSSLTGTGQLLMRAQSAYL